MGMSRHTMTGPDGRKHTITGPSDATEQEVAEAIQYQLDQQEKNLQQTPETNIQKEDPLAGDDSAFRRVSDVGIDLAKGAVGLVILSIASTSRLTRAEIVLL